jgi:ABC-2 type transporter
MLRSIQLVFLNEFRLQRRDHASLFMIFIAPVVIIAVAGFSLANLFGSPAAHTDYSIAVVDEDHGRIAAALLDALARQPGCTVVKTANLEAARRFVLGNAQAPLALVIPFDTSAAFESGRAANVEILVDPIKRLQASEIELSLNKLSQALEDAAETQMRRKLGRSMAELRAHLEEVGSQSRALELAIRDYRYQLGRAKKEAEESLRVQLQRQFSALKAQTQASIDQALSLTRERLGQAVAEKQRSMLAVTQYLQELKRSEAEFDQWFEQLKTLAGSNAARIPPPPQFPPPPNQQQLVELTRPLTIAIAPPQLPTADIKNFNLPLPDLPSLPKLSLDLSPGLAVAATDIVLPGSIAWKDGSITSSHADAGAFEQYVPGFGVTFLLIDMLWGMSVALMDERQWGTLQRLRISGASIPGMLIGRLSARTLIGFVQMIVLFGVGWLLFGIKLGHNPAMLLLPAAAIALVAGAFGLVIAAVAPSRDSVLPIGSVAAMVMSAIGGCWWPLEFEPHWMQLAAAAVPTTWTMRGFNDLMIRGLAPVTVLWPTMIAAGMGLVLLACGIAGSPRLYR